MEREITFSMFSIRVAEMRTAWLKNRDEMETALPRLSDLVQDQLSTQQSCEKLSCQVAALKQQTLMLEEACADKGSALYTLAERYSGYAVVLGAEKSARAAFQEKLTEWEQWHQLHKVALNTIRGPGIALMFSDLSKPLNLGVPSFEPVVEFLQNAGQSHTVQQCEQCESELSQLVHQRRVLLRSCMEQMHTYCTVVAQYPPAYLQINRVARWSHWLRQLLDDWTQSRCQQVVSEFHRHYGDAMQALSTSQSMLAIELKLSSVIADTNTKLLKLAERHNQEAVNPDHLQQAVEETSANITKFVQENRTSGSVSLASVVITALCALNKRYLVMEGAAAAAGDRLMDLTSRDGDWFLDELCSMSANVCQLVALLQQHYSLAATGGALEELAQRAIVVTRGTHHVYLALQDLNTNFRKIILPEACKRIQSEEPSVAVAVATLNRLVHDAGMPLDSLLGHMDTKMRNIIMGIGQVDSETAPIVDALKRGFAALLRGDGGATVTAEMTAGQMLLMGFNGLFTRLSDVHAEVAAAFTELEPPPLWRKIDVVREARGLQMCVFGEEILSLLEDIFFIKKLQAMREFFDICCKLANTLYDKESTGEVYDDEQLSRPIKHYIAEFVRKKVIGLPSQVLGHLLCVYMHALGVDVSAEIELKDIGAESKVAIEDLCKKAVEAGLREGRVQHTDLTQASTLTSTHDTVWRKQDLVRRLGTSMMLLQSSMATAKMQLTRFQWLHEDALTQAHGGQLKTTPSRSTVMSDMRKAVQVVLTLEPAIAGVQEKYAQQEASISQRLRWAAGANQSLQATLDKFEQASRDRTDFLLVESKIAVDISNLCNSVLHCEALRTRTPEAINGDRNFVVLINRCQESYVLKDNCSDSVSPLEASLVEQCPLPAAAPVMLEWVQTALACVVTATDVAAEAAAERERAVERCRDGVRGHVTMIRNLLATHHKLMSDVRSILKTMAKYEEEQQGEAAAAEGGSSVRAYISLYRGFSESFSGVLKNIMAEEQLNGTADDVAALLRQIPRIYDGLVEFASPITQQSSGDTSEVSSSHPAAAMRLPLKQADAKDSKPSPVKPTSLQMFFSSTPPGGPTGPKSAAAAAATSRRAGVARDPRTGKALQERNSYAIGVWRRIKMKLDGRDPDPARRLNVPEQVDFVIKEATNIENLALLYEGWTPWV